MAIVTNRLNVSSSTVTTAQHRAHLPREAGHAEPAPSAESVEAPRGWTSAPPARASHGLKVTAAAIDDGPAISPKLQLPAGFTAESAGFKLNESLPLPEGKTATLAIDYEAVKVKGPGGRSFEIGSEATSDVKDVKAAFADNFKGLQKEDLENLETSWEASRTLAGVGSAGKLMSVEFCGSSFTGGAHPNSGSAVSTYDTRTGQQVTLDQLLPKAQVDALAKDITARLKTLKAADGVDSDAWRSDAGTMRDTINSNFALTTDRSGAVKIHIAWESGVHALGPQMAHFTVDAPTDPVFKKKVGLE